LIPRDRLEVKAWYVHFFPGESFARLGGRAVDYLAASVGWSF
jgi:hypothetical protein